MDNQATKKVLDPLELPVPEGTITRGRSKKFKETLNGIMASYEEVPTSMTSRLEEFGVHDNQVEEHLNIIQVQDGRGTGTLALSSQLLRAIQVQKQEQKPETSAPLRQPHDACKYNQKDNSRPRLRRLCADHTAPGRIEDRFLGAPQREL